MMKLINQCRAIDELQKLANYDRHSLLVEGPSGSGKTYLSKQYAAMLNIEDFQIVQPKVADLKTAIESCYQINTNVVICVENLDLGVSAAAYSILKFLEEPAPHVYIIITCRNLKRVPDTIVSRSSVVTLPPPTDIDLAEYAKSKDTSQYVYLEQKPIWRCVKTYSDVETVLQMPIDHIQYFDTLNSVLTGKSPVSDMIWALQKYPDGSSTELELVIRYIMCTTSSNSIWRFCNDCLKELSYNRISTHAILAKFVFDFKYTA